MLKACLNGPRLPGSHPALPVTPGQLATAAAAAADAGADAVHLHVKDAHGADTLEGQTVAEVLDVVRARAPDVPLGVTTGAWASPDPADRVDAVTSWTVLPDFASVNWHERGADAVATALLAHGVDVEAGMWDADAIRAWQSSPLRQRCFRILVEPLDDSADVAVERAEELLSALGVGREGRTPDGVPVLLHGMGHGAWPVLRYAVARRLDTRIGLEDTLLLPDGSPAPGNAALVMAARSLGAR